MTTMLRSRSTKSSGLTQLLLIKQNNNIPSSIDNIAQKRIEEFYSQGMNFYCNHTFNTINGFAYDPIQKLGKFTKEYNQLKDLIFKRRIEQGGITLSNEDFNSIEGLTLSIDKINQYSSQPAPNNPIWQYFMPNNLEEYSNLVESISKHPTNMQIECIPSNSPILRLCAFYPFPQSQLNFITNLNSKHSRFTQEELSYAS